MAQRQTSYMNDGYGDGYVRRTSGDYTYVGVPLDGCARWAKHLVFAINFAMSLLGVALIVMSFLIQKPDLNFIQIDDSQQYMLYAAVAFGTLTVTTSFLGCSGATTETHCIMVFYIIFLVLMMCMEITIASYIFTSSDELNSYANAVWEHMSKNEQREFEDINDCQGYEECRISIEEDLQSNAVIVCWVCSAAALYQMGMISMGCVLCKAL